MYRQNWLRFIAILVLGLTYGLLRADQEPRLALVIGNAAYQDSPPLVNTLNDARDMADKLRALGFEVTKVENAGEEALERAVSDFIRRARTSPATALVYYSGHGLQVNGQNYLLPVDAEIRDEWDVPNEGVPVNRVLAGLGNRGARAVNLVILDACRNNPFKTSDRRAVGDRGLARVTAPGGTLVLYAAKPGETASDNPGGRNGLFTQHLLTAMDRPGLQVEDTFKQAAEQVYQASSARQDPWMEGRIRGRFYFVPPPAGAPDATAIPPPPPPPPMTGGYLQVVVDLDHVQVTVNGRAVGTASAGQPLNLSAGLPSGPVQVEVSVPGSPPQVRTVQVQAGRWTQAVFNLGGAIPPAPEADPVAVEQSLRLERAERLHLQEALNLLGHEAGTVDGIWGPRTRAAIAAWQRLAGREATGYLTAEGYRTLLEQAVPVLAERRKHPGPDPEMVTIPGGCFQMGSPASEAGRNGNERRHRVCVKGFELGKYEVTVGAFRRFVEATGYRADSERTGKCWAVSSMGRWLQQNDRNWKAPGFQQGERHPVVCVSWNDAQAYVAWLNRETGGGYRLPTEAEWEYAARAGTRSARHWGDAPDQACRFANVADHTAQRRFGGWIIHNCDDGVLYTAAVGRYRANPYGLHDMLGNVWEWTCSDWDEQYQGAEQRCSTGGANRPDRGGGWGSDPQFVRSAVRSGPAAGLVYDLLGFRIAK